MVRRLFALCAAVLVTAGCGTASSDPLSGSRSADATVWRTLETVDGRDIIAKLEQKGTDPAKRQQLVDERLAYTDFEEGFFEDRTEAKDRDMKIQLAEGPSAIEAVETVYGMDEFNREGILFYELEADGASHPGVWIGVKEPDDRLEQVLDRLQRKVDAGELLAEPIHFFRSPHTQQELVVLQDQIGAAVKERYGGSGSYAAASDVRTGVVTVEHDFLQENDLAAIRADFKGQTIEFRQTGRMAPAPGQSAIVLPKSAVADLPVDEGGFVLDTREAGFLVAGGTEGVVSYSFAEAARLTPGSRVTVEATGALAESYPAQGQAKYVTVHPDYRPAGASLSESEVIRMAIEATEQTYLIVETVSFDPARKIWTVTQAEGEDLMFQDR